MGLTLGGVWLHRDEQVCVGDQWDPALSCSVLHKCVKNDALLSIVAGTSPLDERPEPEPILIELVGNVTLRLTAGTKYSKCPRDAAPLDICDRGALGKVQFKPYGACSAHDLSKLVLLPHYWRRLARTVLLN